MSSQHLSALLQTLTYAVQGGVSNFQLCWPFKTWTDPFKLTGEDLNSLKKTCQHSEKAILRGLVVAIH